MTCSQRAIPFRAQWALFIVGGGGVLVAGNTSLVLALRWLVERGSSELRLPEAAVLRGLLAHSISFALVVLGGGLTVSGWWAWRTVGTLADGDLRLGWMGITWVIAAMSLAAWQLEGPEERWAARLALAAAAALMLGFLVSPEAWHLLGT